MLLQRLRTFCLLNFFWFLLLLFIIRLASILHRKDISNVKVFTVQIAVFDSRFYFFFWFELIQINIYLVRLQICLLWILQFLLIYGQMICYDMILFIWFLSCFCIHVICFSSNFLWVRIWFSSYDFNNASDFYRLEFINSEMPSCQPI